MIPAIDPVANPITRFLVAHMIGVYFIYGLAFFVLGVVLALASRQRSALPLMRASRRCWQALGCCTARTNGWKCSDIS